MGALRINKVDGTSTFVDLSGYAAADIENVNPEFTRIALTPIGGGSATTVTITRFAATEDSVWRKASEAAYIAIRTLPIEYGYPDLGNDLPTYMEYDAGKIALDAIQSALGSSTSDEIVYSEITAIADNATSKAAADKIIDQILTIESDAEAIEAETVKACIEETSLGNTFNSECGGSCEPLAGPAPNEPCCEAAGLTCKNDLLKQIVDVAGPISTKHQYLFASVDISSPA
jgi:hypothetical protein